MLGPGLFRYYINDLSAGLNSIVGLFADNTIAPHDAGKVQADLTTMGDWEVLWKMKFHADKCNVLTVTNKKENITDRVQATWPNTRQSDICQMNYIFLPFLVAPRMR